RAREDERADELWVRERERQRDVAAHREAGDVRSAAVEDRRCVLGKLLDPVGRVGHGRASRSARVERDRVEALGEDGRLVTPGPRALPEPLVEQERLAGAVLLDVQVSDGHPPATLKRLVAQSHKLLSGLPRAPAWTLRRR